ncbi:polysaccharide deacetylase family protein [Bacillus cereus]|uniref:polysaccharide deacetylase family protein n=1 Tax=Bacillus cereus TaxID=1396 RepID=UPI000BEE2D29|nr:polysaccharide deacetylase family protein [Bacillus cereus]PEA01034.1 hypothetical protein CON37_30210 [Bacillus cereus]
MKRMLYLLVVGGFIMSLFTAQVKAETKKQKILVIYSTENEKQNAQTRMLDLLIGGFSKEVTWISAGNVSEIKDIPTYTHVFYISTVLTTLSSEVKQILNDANKSVFYIGENIGQVERFSFLQVLDSVSVTSVTLLPQNLSASIKADEFSMKNMILSTDVETLITGNNQTKTYPLLVKKEHAYYFASTILDDPYNRFIAANLFSFFDKKIPEDNILIHLRLEDIHPLSDNKKLMEIATFLYKKKIPYIVTVIPVYKNTKTNKEYHLSDVPEIIKTLQYMQEHGASIVLHGYTHQYYDSETGEGFEFWDVKNNRPIIAASRVVHESKQEKDFTSKKEYRVYLEMQKTFEESYIKERLNRGVEELVTHDLYPIAFEAPHYAMSQFGYEVVSKKFSTILGQVQVSDETWKSMAVPPYYSYPAMLHGTLLIPETIEFVDLRKKDPVGEILKLANEYASLPGGTIGGFYHPYLGIEPLKELITGLENIPNLKWVDLKKQQHEVKTDKVYIQTKDGKINVTANVMFHPYALKYYAKKWMSTFLMVITVITLFLILVISFFLIGGAKKRVWKK